MARWNHPINAFNAGEFSPHLAGRFDLDKYNSSVETMLNFIIQPEGGAKKRSGFRYVKPLQNGLLTAKLIPFLHSSGGTTFPYILEFGLNYIKFFRNEAPVLESTAAITGITQANPAVVTATGHTLVDGDEVQITAVGGMTEVNGRFFTVSGAVLGVSFELAGEVSTNHTAYTSGGLVARVHKITTTYTQDQVQEIEWAQSGDTLYLAHPAHAPAQLTRTDHTAWTLADVAFDDGPYLSENPTANGANNDALTGAVIVDFDDATFINGGLGFLNPQDVGRLIRIRHDSATTSDVGHMTIGGVATNIRVTGTVINTFLGSGAAVFGWRLGAFFPANFPRAVSFGDGRLWWGGTPSNPSTVFGSKSGNFLNYSPSTWKDDVVADDNAVTYTIGVNQVSDVQWLISAKVLMIGTPGGVFPLQASVNSEPITPTNVNVPSPTQIRAAAIHPVVVDNAVVYINRIQNKLLVIRYALASDGYVAEDLTRFADHVGSESPFTAISYQQDPDSMLWCVRGDGSFATLTYRPEEDIVAWSRQVLGGSFSGGDPIVEDVAIVESPNADHDQVWALVKRTVNGVTVRYIEFLEEEFPITGALEDGFFVDSGISFSGTPLTTFTGLSHLEGETVDIMADGAPVAPAVVSGGAITLETTATDVHVGYAYNSDLFTQRLNVPAESGTSQGLPNRVSKVLLRLYRSAGGLYGPDADTLTPIVYRTASDLTATPVPLFTGDQELTMDPPADPNDPRLFIRARQPIPFNILSFTALGTGGDR